MKTAQKIFLGLGIIFFATMLRVYRFQLQFFSRIIFAISTSENNILFFRLLEIIIFVFELAKDKP